MLNRFITFTIFVYNPINKKGFIVLWLLCVQNDYNGKLAIDWALKN